jgi:glutamate formiminotransferase
MQAPGGSMKVSTDLEKSGARPTAAVPLLAVPNFSEGRDWARVEAIARAFTAQGTARLLDVHADVDHHRAVLTLAGIPGTLWQALVCGAAEATRRIDLGISRERSGARDPEGRDEEERARGGQHPHVGALDVVPLVYLDPALRGAACAEALVVAEEIAARLAIPVFLYGELAGGRTRAELRRGGVTGLAERLRSGELRPDFGPRALHPTAGATLVGARGPLVAFNLELAPPATLVDARRIASLIREGGAEGLPGVRAIGVELRHGHAAGGEARTCGASGEARHGHAAGGEARGHGAGPVVAQVSMNVERPAEVPLRVLVAAVRAHARVACAELVGLAPRVALEGFPADLPMPGFDPARHVIENALAAAGCATL